jgi:hypothetical protein
VAELVYETHSTTTDNEAGIATGWLGGSLSSEGRGQAVALGERRRDDGIAAAFVSDLARALETAEIAVHLAAGPVRRTAAIGLRRELAVTCGVGAPAGGSRSRARGLRRDCQCSCTGGCHWTGRIDGLTVVRPRSTCPAASGRRRWLGCSPVIG